MRNAKNHTLPHTEQQAATSRDELASLPSTQHLCNINVSKAGYVTPTHHRSRSHPVPSSPPVALQRTSPLNRPVMTHNRRVGPHAAVTAWSHGPEEADSHPITCLPAHLVQHSRDRSTTAARRHSRHGHPHIHHLPCCVRLRVASAFPGTRRALSSHVALTHDADAPWRARAVSPHRDTFSFVPAFVTAVTSRPGGCSRQREGSRGI